MHLYFLVKILVPIYLQKNAFPSTATRRLSDGTAVSVSRLGLSPRSARLQTVLFETDTAGGKMAGGVRGRGGPNHHPLPVSMAPQLGRAGPLVLISSLDFMFSTLKILRISIGSILNNLAVS